VIIFHCFVPYNMAVMIVGLQSICLLFIQGIYFLLLGNGNIVVGGLLDFALIEIPTFFYIGIFLQIIIVPYWLFFKSDEVSKNVLALVVGITLILDWLVFASIMIAVAFANTSSSFQKSCNCCISDPLQENNTAKIIQIVYKSVVLVLAVCVAFITIILGREHVKKRNHTVYFQVVGLTIGLLMDCVVFVIYYSLNVILWFTELIPICLANMTLGWTEMKYSVMQFMQKQRERSIH
jgi:hypothetical protein